MTAHGGLTELARLLARALYLGMEQLAGPDTEEPPEAELWEERGVNAALLAEDETAAKAEAGASETAPGPAPRAEAAEPLLVELAALLRGGFGENSGEAAAAERPPWSAVGAERAGVQPGEDGAPRPAAGGAAGRTMEEISAFFERDARRYDRGF